jgi:uncharacterized protein YaiE (UPF0345 family)
MVHMGALTQFSTTLIRFRISAKQKIVLSILLIALIGIFRIGDYGFSTDEATGMRMVWQNVDLITNGKPLEDETKYSGTVFNIMAEGAFQVQSTVAELVGYQSRYEAQSYDDTFSADYAHRMYLKHALTFLWSLLAYVAVAALVGLLCGWEYAWLGVIALALFPRFWGDSFFNPKDIPFAALLTLTTYLGSRLVARYTNDDQDTALGWNRVTLYTLLFGGLIGLLAGIKLVGSLVILFVVLTHALVSIGRKVSVRHIATVASHYLLMVLAWVATTIAFHPAAWSNPIGWLFEAAAYPSQNPWSKQVLFDGQQARPADLPWFYLPKFLMITTPVVWQVLFVVGLLFVLARFAGFSRPQRIAVIMVLMQLVLLPIFVIANESTMYDGIRHFLFILPMIAMLTVAGLVAAYTVLKKGRYRLLMVGVVGAALAVVGVDMAKLHPYEYVYFNRLSGGLAGAQGKYETDYWALSMREGMEWVGQNAASNATVVVGGPFYPAKLFAGPDISVVSYNPKEELALPKPFYYIGMSKYDYDRYFDDCPVVYQVNRDGVPFSTVKRCEEDGSAGAQDQKLIPQEINYLMPEASEAYLVWGVNGWKVAPETQRPRGTIIKDMLMYTPMRRVDDGFIAKVKVPEGTKVDYIFLITSTASGQPTRIWDANGQPKRNFRTTVLEEGLVRVEPTIDLNASVASVPSGGGAPGLLLLLIVGGIVGGYISIRSYLSERGY